MEAKRLFSGCATDPAFYDEVFDGYAPRARCRKLWEVLDGMPRAEIAVIQERAERSFLHEGITFAVCGKEEARERILPIDLLPRILDGTAWDLIERGLHQRLEALNLFLGDIDGTARCLADGVVPVVLVRGCGTCRPARWKGRLRGRRAVSQAAVRAYGIVVTPPQSTRRPASGSYEGVG